MYLQSVESYNYPHHYHYQSNHHHHITQNPTTTPNNHHNQHYNLNNLSSFNLNFHQQLPYNTYIDADADFTLKKVYEHPSSLVQEIPKKFTTFHGYKPQYDNNQSSSNQQPINQEQKRAKHISSSKIHQPSQNSRQPPPPVPVPTPVPVRSFPNVPDPKISSIPQTHGCQYQHQDQSQPQRYLKDPRASTKIGTGTTQQDLILQELREKIPKKPKSIRINKPAIKPSIHFDDQVHCNDDDDNDNDDKDHHHHPPSSYIFESIHSTYNNHYHDNYGYDSHEHENENENDHSHHHNHNHHHHPHHHKDQYTNSPKNKTTFKNNKQLHYAATYSSSSQLQKKLVQLPRAELCPSISRSTRTAGKSTVATATTLFPARNNGNGNGNGNGNLAEGARENPNRKSELTPLPAHKPLQYIFGFEPQVILLEKVKNDNNNIISRSKSKSKTVSTAAASTRSTTTTLTKMAPTIPHLKNQNPAKGTSSSSQQQLQQNNPVTLNPMSLQSQSISLAKEGKDNNLISIHTTNHHPSTQNKSINNNSNNNNNTGKNNGGDYNNYKIHKHTIRIKNMPVGPISGSETTNNYFNQSNNNSNSNKHVSTISSNIFNNDRVTLTINAATPTPMPNPSDHLININSSSSSSSSSNSSSASSDNNNTNTGGNGSGGSVRVISTTNSRNNHHHQQSNGPSNRQNHENIFVEDSDNHHHHHTQNQTQQNHKNITRCSLGPATGSSQIEITNSNSNHNHTKSNKKHASSSNSSSRNHRRGSTTVTDLTHIVNDSDTNDSDDHGLNFPVNITNNTEMMIPTSHQHHNGHNHNHHTHNHNQSDSTSSTSVSGGSTTSSTTKMISTADVFANSISYPGSKPNPYCPSCHGVVPLDHLEPSLDLPPAKSEHGGFWNQQHNHNFRHTTLHRESSFHSYGGFTLNGQPGHITANKHKVRRFCSSHKVAFVVSTFSMIVTIGLIITLLLMKKKGMMEAM